MLILSGMVGRKSSLFLTSSKLWSTTTKENQPAFHASSRAVFSSLNEPGYGGDYEIRAEVTID